MKKEKKIFIPLSITETVAGYSYFFSNKKVAIMLVYWVAVTLGVVMLKGIIMSPLALFIYLAICFFIFTLIFRFKILEENRLEKLYNEQILLNPTTSKPFWRIIDISEDGIIRYDLNKAAVIIKIEKSTIVGREDGFVDYHFISRSDMLRYLYEKGYNILYINTEHNHNLREKVNNLYNLIKEETDIIKDIVSTELGFIVDNSYIYGIQETEYYIVYTDSYSKIKNLKQDSLTALNYIRYTAVSGTTILNKEQVTSLFKHLYGIKYIDYEKLIMEEIQSPIKEKIEFRIIREYDKLGAEKVKIDLSYIQKPTKQNKNIQKSKQLQRKEELDIEIDDIISDKEDTNIDVIDFLKDNEN